MNMPKRLRRELTRFLWTMFLPILADTAYRQILLHESRHGNLAERGQRLPTSDAASTPRPSPPG